MNARSVGFQYAYSAWNSFVTEKYVLLRHEKFEILMAVYILMVVVCVESYRSANG
jgi:fluoride ion exporter CrcB/FEX